MIADDTIIITAFGTAFSALGGVIVVLARKFYAEHQSLKVSAKECQEDRDLLWEKITELSGKVGKPVRCHKPDCPWPIPEAVHVQLSKPRQPPAS